MGYIPPTPPPRARLSPAQTVAVLGYATNCRNCGAPPLPGIAACRYCGTARPATVIGAEASFLAGPLSTPTAGRLEAV